MNDLNVDSVSRRLLPLIICIYECLLYVHFFMFISLVASPVEGYVRAMIAPIEKFLYFVCVCHEYVETLCFGGFVGRRIV